jgi:hypothetical protein
MRDVEREAPPSVELCLVVFRAQQQRGWHRRDASCIAPGLEAKLGCERHVIFTDMIENDRHVRVAVFTGVTAGL